MVSKHYILLSVAVTLNRFECPSLLCQPLLQSPGTCQILVRLGRDVCQLHQHDKHSIYGPIKREATKLINSTFLIQHLNIMAHHANELY